jgi:hypothetical protein
VPSERVSDEHHGDDQNAIERHSVVKLFLHSVVDVVIVEQASEVLGILG